MNKKIKEYYQRNTLLQSIKYNDRSGNKEGMIKIYPNNSLTHERIKLEIAYKLKNLGFQIWSECTFVNGGRADLVAIKAGKGYIIEVAASETEERFLAKKEKYPAIFEIIKVNVTDFDINKFEL